MNILIFNWRDWMNPNAGGAELVTLEHAKAWVKAGYKVTWFTSMFFGSKDKEFNEGIEIIRRGSPYTVFAYAPFFYLFSGRKFDLVIDEIHGIPFFTPFYVRIPKIAFIHEVAGEIWHFMFPFPLNYIGILSERIYLTLYRNIPFWVDAKSTVEELVSYGIKRENITDIPCPVSNPVVSKLPEKEKVPTFIFVSRLVKMKGIENVMKAFSLIKKKLPNAKLWIVGKGDKSYENSLLRLAKVLDIKDNCKFYGYVNNDEKLRLMGKAHLLLHASVKEGWGLVVLEAASQGTPSVVYNVAGLRDVVKHNETGIVISQNTPEHLAYEAISLLKDNKIYYEYRSQSVHWSKKIQWSNVTEKSIKLISKIKSISNRKRSL